MYTVDFNSNAGVIKGMIGKITDQINAPHAFGLLQVSWASGYVFGGLIGEWHTNLFHAHIWIDHPCLLPCLTIAGFASVGCVVSQSCPHFTLALVPFFSTFLNRLCLVCLLEKNRRGVFFTRMPPLNRYFRLLRRPTSHHLWNLYSLHQFSFLVPTVASPLSLHYTPTAFFLVYRFPSVALAFLLVP